MKRVLLIGFLALLGISTIYAQTYKEVRIQNSNLIKQGQYTQAIALLENSVSNSTFTESQKRDLQWLIAEIYRIYLEDFTKAETAYLKAQQLGKRPTAVKTMIMLMRQEQGRKEEAISLAKEILTNSTDYTLGARYALIVLSKNGQDISPYLIPVLQDPRGDYYQKLIILKRIVVPALYIYSKGKEKEWCRALIDFYASIPPTVQNAQDKSFVVNLIGDYFLELPQTGRINVKILNKLYEESYK